MKKKIMLWLPTALFCVFSVFFYGPAGIYLSNAEEIWFGLGDVMKITGVVSAAVLAVLLAVGLALPEKASVFAAKLVFGISLALYIQGNYINISYGSGVLDGSEIVWSDYTRYAVVDTLVWAVCILLPFALGWIPRIRQSGKAGTILAAAAAFLLVIQIPAFVTQLVGYKPSAQRDLKITDRGMLELSDKENVIVFILDTYDEQYLLDFLEAHPEYEEKLADFVHYDNTLASGARTILAIPSMLTGQPFRRETTYSDYLEEIWSGENALSVMSEKGVDVRVFSSSTYFSPRTTEYVENFEIEGSANKSYVSIGKKLYKLTGFVFAPHLAKRFLWFDTSEFRDVRDDTEAYLSNDIAFIRRYREETFSLNDSYDKAFRIYHLMGMHPPYKLGADGTQSSDATLDTVNQALLDLILEMTDEMKELDVYDDATIIIVADHGDLNLAEWPLFLLKEPGHTGPLETNHSPVSGFDLPIYLCDHFGGSLDDQEYGLHLSDLTEDMERERHFFLNSSGSSRVTVKEYTTVSDAWDTEALTQVGEYEDANRDEPYQLGTELSFKADATGNRYSVKGFSKNTGFRTRLRGPEAILRIPIADLPKSGTLKVELGVYTGDSKTRASIIYANGIEVFNGTVDKSHNDETIDFEVPVEAVRTEEGDILTISMQFPEAEDKTTEGYSLVSLRISK